MLTEIAQHVADAVMYIGYPGIVLLMAIESSFIPFPSEIIMPPAGYHIAQGNMSWAGVLLSGLIGSLIGAYINYVIAIYLGRPFFIKYGKYFLVSEASLDRCDRFFAQHGAITTFIGRLIPTIRQLISLPAGLARMNLALFSFYTALGAGIWITVLTYVGYLVGENKELIAQHLHTAVIWAIVGSAIIVAVYVVLHRRKQARAQQAGTHATAESAEAPQSSGSKV